MKRVFFVTLAAVMMLAACKKDVEKPQPKAFDPYDDRAVEARIKEFNQKLQQKSGEPMTIEDAVWCIEAALNYNYCRADVPQRCTYEDSLYFEIPIRGNMVLFNNIAGIYVNIAQKIQNILSKENLNIVVVDVQPKKKNELLELNVHIVINNQLSNKNVIFPNDFTIGWKWGFLKGTCGGDYIEISDASDQLTYWLNTGIVTCHDCYYTNIEIIPAEPGHNFINPNDNMPEDNYLDYLIFINRKYGSNNNLLPNFDPLGEYCITANELNFYKWSYRNIIANTPSQGGIRPEGKILINTIIYDRRTFYCDNSGCFIKQVYHFLNNKYGIKHSITK